VHNSSSTHPLLASTAGKHPELPNRIETRLAEYLQEVGLTGTQSTVARYSTILTGFQRYAADQNLFMVEDMTQQLCRGWFIHLLGTKRIKESTLGLHRVVLSQFIQFLKEAGYFKAESPLTNIRRVPVNKAVKQPFTREEFDKLLSLAPSMKQQYWTYALMMSYHTGLRLSDVAMLSRDAINWEEETITLIPKKTLRKQTEVCIPIETKEFYPFLRAFVDAPIPPFYEFAKQYISPEMACEMLKYNGTRNVLSSQMKRLCRKAGLPDRTFHKLRDTFASRLMNSGNDAIVVASMTGHTDLNTLKGYVHVNNDRKRAALANSV
jgi:integrase